MERRIIRSHAAVALAIAACGGAPSGPGPVVEGPAILSITPGSGTTAGGTDVTIRGLRFSAGATVTFGARTATDVSVQGGEVITARTPAGAGAGAVDVVVAVGGRSAVLTGGFTYQIPAPTEAPIIKSIAAQGGRPGQPPNFADRGETIRISAVIEDADTAPAQLTFEWKACGGVFTGAGAQVDWQAPAGGSSPQTCTIDLTVVDGPHRVSGSIAVRVHDSAKEIADLALEFLTEFADSSIAPAAAVRHFSDSCPGKAAELEDVIRNRQTYTMNSHTYGAATVSIAFGGVCAFRARRADACLLIPVEWRSTIKATGKPETTAGASHITAVYEASRWWLCDSEFEGTSTSGVRFMR
jgi:hypothetical protein